MGKKWKKAVLVCRRHCLMKTGLLDVAQCRLLRKPRRKGRVTLKIKMLGIFEISINIYQSARRDIPKDAFVRP
jgi:hypothetical protein